MSSNGPVNYLPQAKKWRANKRPQSQPAANLQLGDLRLRANPADNTLYLVDNQGCVITPTYQGVVPSHFIYHALSLLLVLIDPWISDYQKVGRPLPININTDPNNLMTVPEPGDQVEFTPRHEEGRIVFRPGLLARASRFVAGAG